MRRRSEEGGSRYVMRDSKRQYVIISFLGIVPVVWLALLIAPFIGGGFAGIIKGFGDAFESPFSINLCEDSLRTVLIFLMVYGLVLGAIFSSERNYRRREEHGSAHWTESYVLNKKYAARPYSDNKILTKNVALGLDGRKHRRNLNVLVCGGSGSGKTRFYAKPNIMQANTSYVILDPKRAVF